MKCAFDVCFFFSSRRRHTRSHSSGRKTGRGCGAGAGQVRGGHQPQDGQRTRSRNFAEANRPRRRGNRVNRWHTTLGTPSSNRKSVVEGKSEDIGGRRIIKIKK